MTTTDRLTRAYDTLLSGPHSVLLMLALVGLAAIALGALIDPPTDDDDADPAPVTWTADNAVNRRQARR